MFPTDQPFVLLESRLGAEAGGRLYSNPAEIIECWSGHTALAALEQLVAARAQGFHAAGYFSYELGYALEPALATCGARGSNGPLAWFGLFQPPVELSADELNLLFAELAPPRPLTNLVHGHALAEHMEKVEAILELIRAGDLYQANLTFPVRFRYGGNPASLYAALRVGQPVAHGALINTGAQWTLSVSPELFFSVREGTITARPMKGTAPRGVDPVADETARAGLARDPKQRAENLMIVDLLRNDLSRVCAPGSVKTAALFEVETYPSFHAMTGTVTGALREGLGLKDLLGALFPCGSVVGAPKIRAAEVIADLESEPRGGYCGAIGAIAPDGDMAFSVAIRTLELSPSGAGRYGVGGGIVADSNPTAEYAEALLKAKVLTDLAEPFELIETLRWDPEGGFLRLDRHLDRLERSAAALGFRYLRPHIERRLAPLAAGRLSDSPLRVRIILSPSGEADITAVAVEPNPTADLRVIIGDETLDSADPFLRHKTSRRARHDRAHRAAVHAGGDEALLLNEAGLIADGARSTLFVSDGGRFRTPSTRSGALPGILRQVMIERGEAFEAEIRPDELAGQSFVLGNSLRGLRRGRLIEEV